MDIGYRIKVTFYKIVFKLSRKDAFGEPYNARKRLRVTMKMTEHAKEKLLLDFPGTAKYLEERDGYWYLDTYVTDCFVPRDFYETNSGEVELLGSLDFYERAFRYSKMKPQNL